MARQIFLGMLDFERIRKNNYFYVDKTAFITDWWKNGSLVTLMTRPRRFGKTVMIYTIERFFSTAYKDQAELFDGLDVWQDADMRRVAGTVPVIKVTFGGVKGGTYAAARALVVTELQELFGNFVRLRTASELTPQERQYFAEFGTGATDADIQNSLRRLSAAVFKTEGVRPIILVDEYDTPMQEAWLRGYWTEMADLMRPMLNLAFKDNPNLERGLLTGITRVSKESVFSDFNNPDVITTSSVRYSRSFGFTEPEVTAALAEYGMTDLAKVKDWYDGFTFGDDHDIYNPWSIVNYLYHKEFKPYWANSSSNDLAGILLQNGSKEVKQAFETLLEGGTVTTLLDEEISYRDFNGSAPAVWALLLACGYLKIVRRCEDSEYELAVTNREVHREFENLIRRWFDKNEVSSDYRDFLTALAQCNAADMTDCLNDLTRGMFSFFDVGAAEPERFYHGFVLGLLVSLKDRYVLTSNRESGRGRYDVVLEPRDKTKDAAFILEFKSVKGGTLEEGVKAALAQITEKRYSEDLQHRGIPADRIYTFGIAFSGKDVLVGGA